MTVLILDVAPENIRGEITKWLLEVKVGVFIGKISKPIRDRLWKKVQDSHNDIKGGLLIYSFKNQQGFRIEMFGDPNRKLRNFNGVQLIGRKIERKE